jgi:hypothetical protein
MLTIILLVGCIIYIAVGGMRLIKRVEALEKKISEHKNSQS